MNIETSIPVGLTAARIQRANPAIDEEAANTLAAELHEIVSLARLFFSVHPNLDETALNEEADLVLTLLNTAVNVWPVDEDAAASESMWMAGQFIALGADEVFDRFLRVCARITPELAFDLGI